MTTVNAPAPSDLQPWYLRGPDGTAIGADYPTREAAEQAAAQLPGHTVDGPDLYVVGPRGWVSDHVQHVETKRVEPRWKPRGWGGVE